MGRDTKRKQNKTKDTPTLWEKSPRQQSQSLFFPTKRGWEKWEMVAWKIAAISKHKRTIMIENGNRLKWAGALFLFSYFSYCSFIKHSHIQEIIWSGFASKFVKKWKAYVLVPKILPRGVLENALIVLLHLPLTWLIYLAILVQTTQHKVLDRMGIKR